MPDFLLRASHQEVSVAWPILCLDHALCSLYFVRRICTHSDENAGNAASLAAGQQVLAAPRTAMDPSISVDGGRRCRRSLEASSLPCTVSSPRDCQLISTNGPEFHKLPRRRAVFSRARLSKR
uniref:Uncharacterized protein n=1 Tax=Steinernema glaseri TaxID=37863 RepID=A0A1I7ZEA0_9BILA